MYLFYKQFVDCHNTDIDSRTIVKYVSQCRSVVDPNKGFMSQIEKFEQLVRSGDMTRALGSFKRTHSYIEREFREVP